MNIKEEPENFDPLVLRVRGLPWSASKEDIVKFFGDSNIRNGHDGIHMTVSREGRPSGEAYVEFETPADADRGLSKDNEHLGSRYIEVFRSKDNEMDWVLRKCGLVDEEAFGDACVRLRGLPFGCSKEEIAQFFSGLEIVRNGITLPTDNQGRSTGEAFVQFASQEIAENAMGKHKEKIGHRYIEIFKSSLQEIRTVASGGGPMRMGRSMGPSSRASPYERPGSFGRGSRGRGRGGSSSYGADRGGNFPPAERIRDTGHNVHLRGLPFRAVERDIFEFFAPVKPIAVRIKYESSGRSSGEADAMFASHQDAVRAMKKDKEKIQHRYIELFLQSDPDPFDPFVGSQGQFSRGAGFMGDDSGSFDDGPEVGFGAPGRGGYGGNGRGFGSEGGRSFEGGYGGGLSPAAPARGGRDFGFSQDVSFSQGSGERSFGGFGRGGQDRGGFSGGRSFAAGASASDRFSADRSEYGIGGAGGGYRNGTQANSMGGGNMRGDMGYGDDRSNESDFYGSGKLFGGNFQNPSGQNMNMMPTTYPGY